jgi:hypothetical protein
VLVPALVFCLASIFVVYCYVELWNASPATIADGSDESVDLVNGVYWISAAFAAVYMLRTALSPPLLGLFREVLAAIGRRPGSGGGATRDGEPREDR